MKTKLTLIAALAIALCGCKGLPKTFMGQESDGAMNIDSQSIYGHHQLRSMNPKPGHSAFIHPDGTMEMRWVGTNGAPVATAPAVTPEVRRAIEQLLTPPR